MLGPIRYGVKLVTYGGQLFDTWVGDDGRFESDSKAEALEVALEFTRRNPKGIYEAQELNED